MVSDNLVKMFSIRFKYGYRGGIAKINNLITVKSKSTDFRNTILRKNPTPLLIYLTTE